jgi:hypothetical protein
MELGMQSVLAAAAALFVVSTAVPGVTGMAVDPRSTWVNMTIYHTNQANYSAGDIGNSECGLSRPSTHPPTHTHTSSPSLPIIDPLRILPVSTIERHALCRTSVVGLLTNRHIGGNDRIQ